jgi:predicted ATPase
MTARSRRTAAAASPDLSGHLERVTIKDFKSLKDVEVELGQVNVFIGANGSGKSCLLEAIGILGACTGGTVDDLGLLRRGVRPGVPELYKSSFQGERISPKISLRALSTQQVEYHAYITNPTRTPGPNWVFGNETLTLADKEIATRGPKGNATALNLSVPLEKGRSVTTLVRASEKTDARVRSFLAALEGFAIFAPVTPVLRGIAPDTAPRNPIGLYGGQLAQAIGLISQQKDGYAVIEDALSLIDWAATIRMREPSRSFLSPSVSTSQYVVELTDRFMARRRNRLSGYDASEGALYILFMLVLAAHSLSPVVFAVDNFDQALNPRTARALTRTFVDYTLRKGRQAFLTTHNPLVLDGLKLDDARVRLYSVSRDQVGHTKVHRVPVRDLASLKRKHGEFAVSRLWLEGRLGGMPDNV